MSTISVASNNPYIVSISQSMSTISVASNNTYIVSMSSSNGIVYREAIGNLANGVCISLTLSFSLAIAAIAIAEPMAIGHSSNNSNIVGTARSYGVGNRKTMSHLAYGVGLSLSLAIVSNMWISY